MKTFRKKIFCGGREKTRVKSEEDGLVRDVREGIVEEGSLEGLGTKFKREVEGVPRIVDRGE